MSIADELLKLEQLRTSGALSESEFTEAKRAVLAAAAADTRPSDPQPSATPVRIVVPNRVPGRRPTVIEARDEATFGSLGAAANRYVNFRIVTGVIGGILALILLIVLCANSTYSTDGAGPGTVCTGPDPSNC